MKKNYLEMSLFIISIICFIFLMFQVYSLFSALGSLAVTHENASYSVERVVVAGPMSIFSGAIGYVSFRAAVKEHRLSNKEKDKE